MNAPFAADIKNKKKFRCNPLNNRNLCGLGVLESWIVCIGFISFLEFLELILHRPGIVASQVVTLNPVIAAPILARDRFFDFRLDFRFFGASLSSRFGLLDLLEPFGGRDRTDGGGSCCTCSRELVLCW